MLMKQKTLPREVLKLQELNKKVVHLTIFMSCNLFHNNVKPLEEDCKKLLLDFEKALEDVSRIAFARERFKQIKVIIVEAPKRKEDLEEIIRQSEEFTPIFFDFCGKEFMNSCEVIELLVWINMANSLACFAEKFDVFERGFVRSGAEKILSELEKQLEKVKSLEKASLYTKEVETISNNALKAMDYLKDVMFLTLVLPRRVN